MKRLVFLLLMFGAVAAHAATYFVRADGGTRYDATDNPTGQCDGAADVAYPGSGTNQHCAFKDVRWAWSTGAYGVTKWVLASGDTLVIRGCTAASDQQNPSNPNCRIGYDTATGTGSQNFCAGISAAYGCSMPPPPNGTSGAHTKILGGCAYDGNCTPLLNTYPVPTHNEVQLFGGFNVGAALWMKSASFIDFAGLEVTTHNGACSRVGTPNYPTGCATSSPVSDFASWGILVDGAHDLTFTDVYVHGFDQLGFGGPLGGTITFTRVVVAFNGFAGWNMDNGTPSATTAQLLQSYVTMFGNGCIEEYPIVHTQFPAKACWDSNSGGFGDSWSAGPTPGYANADTFTCDHCLVAYNTKDGSPGPHTMWKHLSVTNSLWYGNMGQQGKWSVQAGGDEFVLNNLVLGTCIRMANALPGAAQNFNQTTGLGGSYLSNYCRASGTMWADFTDTGGHGTYANNTFVGYNPTFFELGCFTSGACTSAYTLKNNIYLGYTTTVSNYPNSGVAPGLYSFDDAITPIVSNNIEFGIRNADTCGGTILCVDPLLVSEPAQGTYPPDSVFDGFNWHLTSSSPAITAGTTYTGILSTDYYGTAQTSPPTIGAVVFSSGTPTVATPSASPVAGTYPSAQTVTLSDATSGASICYTLDGTTPTAGTPGICDESTYTGPLTISTTTTIKAIGTKAAYLNSAVFSGLYTITSPQTTYLNGTLTGGGTIQ